MPRYLTEGLVPSIMVCDFPQGGKLTVAVFLPSELDRRDPFTFSDDETLMVYRGRKGKRIQVMPYVIDETQAAMLHMADFNFL